MVAIDTLDGREILPEFDRLRKAGLLARDSDGRWYKKDTGGDQ